MCSSKVKGCAPWKHIRYMKILQIIFSLSSGGAERFVVDLSNELSKTNDVTLITLKDDTVNAEKRNFYKVDLSPRVKYINLGLGDGPMHPSYPWKIYKAIRNVNPDVVHFHLTKTLQYLYLSILLLGRKMTFVETIHNDIYKTGYTSLFRKFAYHTIVRHGMLRWAALSDTNYQQVRKKYPKALSRCIYNGRAPMIPTVKYNDVGREIAEMKRDAATKVILHVARCVPQKNQQLLIRSFNTIRKQGRDAILIIIGAGFDSEYGKRLKALAGNDIFFLGTRTNISDYMLQSDIFALSSNFEGMPITLLEAMLSGTPMVSTPVTGAVDVINGKNGVLSKDFTVDSYVATLNELLNHYDSYKTEAMKEKDNSPYTIKHCAEQYMEFYKKLKTFASL